MCYFRVLVDWPWPCALRMGVMINEYILLLKFFSYYYSVYCHILWSITSFGWCRTSVTRRVPYRGGYGWWFSPDCLCGAGGWDVLAQPGPSLLLPLRIHNPIWSKDTLVVSLFFSPKAQMIKYCMWYSVEKLLYFKSVDEDILHYYRWQRRQSRAATVWASE